MSSRINLGKVAFTDKGTYSDAAEYAKFDFVTNGRSTFYSRKDGNSGNALPSTAEEAESSEWWGFLTSAEDAAAAAEEVRTHTPKIVDGYWALYDSETGEYVQTTYKATGRSPYVSDNSTWMVWDDDAQEYKDSGASVSADYTLTKEKVEAVLTGDITTHTHNESYYTKEETDAKVTEQLSELMDDDGKISADNLPTATDSSAGIVSIDPSCGLTIDSSGMLSDSPLVSLSEGDTVVLNYDADGVPAATSFSRTVSLLIDGAEAGADNEKYNLTGALISVDGTEYGANYNVHPFITWTVDSENNTITVSFDYTVSDDNTAALDAILAAGGFTLTGTCNKGIFCSSYFRVLDLSAVAKDTTYDEATTEAAGLMSAADKAAVDAMGDTYVKKENAQETSSKTDYLKITYTDGSAVTELLRLYAGLFAEVQKAALVLSSYSTKAGGGLDKTATLSSSGLAVADAAEGGETSIGPNSIKLTDADGNVKTITATSTEGGLASGDFTVASDKSAATATLDGDGYYKLVFAYPDTQNSSYMRVFDVYVTGGVAITNSTYDVTNGVMSYDSETSVLTITSDAGLVVSDNYTIKKWVKIF